MKVSRPAYHGLLGNVEQLHYLGKEYKNHKLFTQTHDSMVQTVVTSSYVVTDSESTISILVLQRAPLMTLSQLIHHLEMKS